VQLPLGTFGEAFGIIAQKTDYNRGRSPKKSYDESSRVSMFIRNFLRMDLRRPCLHR